MKELYIISYFYAPANMMGAIRMSKLTKYFDKSGYKINVITSVNNSLLFLKEQEKTDPILENDIDSTSIDVTRVVHSEIYIKFAQLLRKVYYTRDNKSKTVKIIEGNKVSFKLKKGILHYILFFISLIQDLDFCIQSKKELKKKYINNDSIVISSYGPLSSHLLAHYLSRKNKMKWIADFRDPIAQPENHRIEFMINKWFEKSICKNADEVIAVSKGYLNSLNVESQTKGQVITNGYDTDDINYVSEKYRSNKFTLVYTGTLYSGKRDLTPLFKALKELIEEKKINIENIQLSYAGVQEEYYIYEAEKYGLEKQVFSLGAVSRLEALNLQASADLLVVATWNNFKKSGILPGKFLEYLMFKKNIIGLVSGKEKNSEIKNMITKTNIGFCYEEGNGFSDFEGLKYYIEKKYKEFLSETGLEFSANSILLDKYSYESIADSYLNVIANL